MTRTSERLGYPRRRNTRCSRGSLTFRKAATPNPVQTIVSRAKKHHGGEVRALSQKAESPHFARPEGGL